MFRDNVYKKVEKVGLCSCISVVEHMIMNHTENAAVLCNSGPILFKVYAVRPVLCVFCGHRSPKSAIRCFLAVQEAGTQAYR